MKFIDCCETIRHGSYRGGRGSYRAGASTIINQLDLFWCGNPDLVVGLIQLMEFGYAMMGGILIVFWKTIDKFGPVEPVYFLVSLMICYSLFVVITAQIIPRYTLCTCLGQLVNKTRLKESVAKHYLEEALHKASHDEVMAESMADDGTNSMSIKSGSTAAVRREALATLVQTKTSDLRNTLNDAKTRHLQRRKMISDPGAVQNMRQMEALELSRKTKADLKRGRSSSGGVELMRRPSSVSELDVENETDHPDEDDRKMGATANLAGEEQDTKPAPGNKYHPHFTAAKTTNPPTKIVKTTKDEEVDDMSVLSTYPTQKYTIRNLVHNPNQHDAKHRKKAPFMVKFKNYLASPTHRYISGLFGTMVAFFFVGMRIESLLLANKLIVDPETTFHFSVEVSFWTELLWLSMFLVMSTWTIILWKDDKPELRVAAIADLIVSGTCLVLLVVAETLRCCRDCDEGCQQFGRRTHGAVGYLEPWTALIGLRVLRFYFGRRYVGVTYDDDGDDDADDSSDGGEAVARGRDRSRLGVASGSANAGTDRQSQKHMTKGVDDDGHPVKAGHGNDNGDAGEDGDEDDDHDKFPSMKDDTGSITELWQHAVTLYPEIVEQHGSFSGELLQAMLGLTPGMIQQSAIEAANESIYRSTRSLMTPGMSASHV